jgi:lipopolysaccharide transport system permease protein
MRPIRDPSHMNSPLYLINSALRNRELILLLIQRDIVGRYRGSLFGVVWAFIHPLFMLSVYTIVFGRFFQAKWGNTGSTWEFALILFSGLIIFNLFSECLTRAPALVANNPNFVKKVIFPLEILPFVSTGSALFHSIVSIVAWLCFYVSINGLPSASILYLPLILLIFMPTILGISWFLAAAAVYFKDISQIMGMATQALLFLSPVFYSMQLVPESFRWVMRLNPLTLIIEQARIVMLAGGTPDFSSLALYAIISLAICWGGFVFFQRLRVSFADVV